MPLTNMAQLLAGSEERKTGTGAFSVANMEMILGVIDAAEKLEEPVIIQVAQARLPFSPLSIIGPMMLAAAKGAKVPVAVHLDHGLDVDTARQALELGFTSVMIDASAYALEENIARTKEIAELAHSYGAAVEAEIGRLGVGEDGKKEGERLYTDPAEAKRLAEETGVDALAVSIGNAHGFYTETPKLNLAVLAEIQSKVDVPLVLHGGSGLTAQDFQNCIKHGVRKVNIATASFNATAEAAKRYTATAEKLDYFAMNREMVEAVSQNVQKHIRIFRNENVEV